MPTEGLWLSHLHGLPEQVKLIPMLNVGCCAGFKALDIASDLVRANPDHVVLIVDAEACSSLSNAMPDPASDTDKMQRTFLVQAALFRDGASAAIVGSVSSRVEKKSVQKESAAAPELAILHSEVALIQGTMDYGISAQEHDGNVIKVVTIKEIPKLIAMHGLKITAEWMAMFRGCRQEVVLMMHPASFNTVNGLVKVLGLKHEQAQVSYDCIETVGNIGGASNLYVMDRWLQDNAEFLSKFNYAVCVAPAAGITIQLVLCKIVGRNEELDQNPTFETDKSPGIEESGSEDTEETEEMEETHQLDESECEDDIWQ